MAASTRPLTLGEILDRTVQIYKRNFLVLVGVAAPAAALIVLLSGGVVVFFSSQMFSIIQAGQTGATPALSSHDLATFGIVFALFLFVGIPLTLGIFGIAFAALTFASNERIAGRAVTIRSAYGYGFRHFWRHIGVLFLQSLFAGIIPYFVFGALVVIVAIVGALAAKSGATEAMAPIMAILLILGFIALLVVCILIWLRLSLAYSASVAENIKAWPALKRSNQLSKGTRGRIFVMFLLVMVLSIVASFALMIPLDIVIGLFSHKSLTGNTLPTAFFMLLQLANLAAGFLVRIFVMPIYTTALVIFYIDQRTRLEGYDIEQLMTQAGWADMPAFPQAVPAPAYPGFAIPVSLEPVSQAPFSPAQFPAPAPSESVASNQEFPKTDTAMPGPDA